MDGLSISVLTICGLEELSLHGARGVTHVLSILDPEQPDPEAFGTYGEHRRAVLRFHDTIEPMPGKMLPEPEHVDAILDFGRSLERTVEGQSSDQGGHLLVHCHAGISRSTAAMAMMLAQIAPHWSERQVLDHLVQVRPKAWPNSRMMAFADERLGRRFVPALGPLYRRQLGTYPHIREFMLTNARGYEVELADAA